MSKLLNYGLFSFAVLLLAGCQTTSYWNALTPYDKAPVDTAGKFNGTYYIGDMYNNDRCASYTGRKRGKIGAPLQVIVRNGEVSGRHSNRSTAKPLTGKAYADGTVKASGFAFVHRTGIGKYTFVDGKIENRVLHAKVDQGLIKSSDKGDTLSDNYAHCDHGTYKLGK